MTEIKFSNSVKDPSDLLGLPCQKEVACEHSYELLEIVFTALF